MSNTTFTLSAPANPAQAVYQCIANFLSTGSAVYGTTAPSMRASTSVTSSGNTTSTAHTTSASIVAGDLLLCFIVTATTNGLTTVPADFNIIQTIALASGCSLFIFGKNAIASDISRTFNAVTAAAANTLIATMSYQNCGGVGFISNATTGTVAVASSNTAAAPSATTLIPDSTVIDVFSSFLTANAGITAPVANTSRAAVALGTNALSVSDATQAVAGATTAATATQGSSQVVGWANITLVLVPAATGGTPPAGGWTHVEDVTGVSPALGTAGAGANIVTTPNTWSIWKSPSASNTAGTDWYLLFGYRSNQQAAGDLNLFIMLSEVYTPATHFFNAPAGTTGGPGSVAPLGSTTPPWAQVIGSGSLIGSAFNGSTALAFSVGGTTSTSAGTTNAIVAANADGFFLTTLVAGALGLCAYAGSATSLVNNAAFTPDTLLLLSNIGNSASSTREYSSITAPFGSYNLLSFWPITNTPGNANTYGTVNGATPSGDLYQAANSSPIATRWLVWKAVTSTLNTQGQIRGLLPAWIQSIVQTGCAWGDTVTEGADTLTYVIGVGVTTVWIDTSVA